VHPRESISKENKMSIQRRDFIQKLTWGAAIGAAAPAARSFATPSESSAFLNLTNPIQITGVPKTGMASLDLMITDLMSAWSVPGMALAVSRNGEIIVARGYGLLDQSNLNNPVNAGNTFRIASVTKPITAVAILQLIPQGKLTLDTPVWPLLKDDYPLFPGKALAQGVDKITIRHLLQHTAGWDIYPDPMFDVDRIADLTGTPRPADKGTIIRYMWSTPLNNTSPGSRYGYANIHYCVLGRVIEHLTRQSYSEYVTGNVLEPLNAIHTFEGSSFLSGRHSGEARYYPYPGEPQKDSVFPPFGKVDEPYGAFDLENMDSHGGWVSSPVDLVAFVNGAFQDNSLIDDVTGNRISTGDGNYYGLGWRLTPTGSDLSRGFNSFNVWHDGSLPGTTSILARTKWSDGSDVCWASVMNIRDVNTKLTGALDQAMWNAVRTLKPFPAPIFVRPWQVRQGLTSSRYQQTFDRLVSQGFRLTHISSYGTGAEAEYAAIWDQTPGPDWQARHGLTAAEYQQAFNQLAMQGYRLSKVDGCSAGDTALYAGIWQKRTGPVWQARHGMTASEYQQASNQLVPWGYRPTWVSGYSSGGIALYAAIWEQSSGPAWQARHGLTSAQYQQTFNQFVAQGYRPRHVSGYVIGNADFYATIWDKSSGPAWEAHHGMTPDQFQQTFNELVWGKGYRLVEVSGSQLGSQTLYAAIWEAV
jgi:CubicO group peptidase (beta-lactamase class C family)